EDGALRSTTITTGGTWNKKSQTSLLSSPMRTTLGVDEQTNARNEAYDLLDALTKSGALSLDHVSLHIVLATTHCFDQSLIDTVVIKNVNPIEKVERSFLLVATTIHDTSAESLIKQEHR